MNEQRKNFSSTDPTKNPPYILHVRGRDGEVELLEAFLGAQAGVLDGQHAPLTVAVVEHHGCLLVGLRWYGNGEYETD